MINSFKLKIKQSTKNNFQKNFKLPNVISKKKM